MPIAAPDAMPREIALFISITRSAAKIVSISREIKVAILLPKKMVKTSAQAGRGISCGYILPAVVATRHVTIETVNISPNEVAEKKFLGT